MEVLPEDLHKSRILFSPLNWGMGHVSRSIPILRKLILQGNTIIIACNKHQADIYKQYFDDIIIINHEGYPFVFGQKGFSSLHFIRSLPRLFAYYRFEKSQVSKWIKEYKIEWVISDQRYGFRSQAVPCIFITHQIKLPVPYIFALAQLINKNLIRKFDHCWIIDSEKERYAGKLSLKIYGNHSYIGIQSRFSSIEIKSDKKRKTLILSGPLNFQEIALHHFLSKYPEIDTLIGPEAIKEKIQKSLTFIASHNWLAVDEVLQETHTLFGFTGYTTYMDVQFLECHWESIPTPGQFEQAYLNEIKKPLSGL